MSEVRCAWKNNGAARVELSDTKSAAKRKRRKRAKRAKMAAKVLALLAGQSTAYLCGACGMWHTQRANQSAHKFHPSMSS